MGKKGGNLAGVGSVAFQFDRAGQFIINSKQTDEETLMDAVLEAGAEDIKNEGDYFEVICPMAEYDAVSQALSERNIETEESDLVYLPNVLLPIEDKEGVHKVMNLIEALEELDDVKAVHSNMDIEDGVLDDEE